MCEIVFGCHCQYSVTRMSFELSLLCFGQLIGDSVPSFHVLLYCLL